MQTVTISKEQSSVVKGWAILAVITIHILAYFPGIFDRSSYQWLVVALDQTARFCVPAFLIVSGYGLAMKYGGKAVAWVGFVGDRLKKLLPLYLLWSGVSILLMRLVPEWVYFNQPKSMVVQLLFGQADYQLYFLPLIFQLYLLFPLIWAGTQPPLKLRRARDWKLNWWLGASLLGQLGLYWWFGQNGGESERLEYVLGLSWLFYFILGIWLARINWQEKLRRGLPWVCLLVWGWVVAGSVRGINAGVDPLQALKFTRWPALVYGTLASLTLLLAGKGVVDDGRNWGEKTLAWLGEKSYLLFLAHTMGLRLFYGLWTGIPSLGIWATAAVIWMGTIWVSVRLGR